jgi:O-antigen/teichoic acid export membrane protein
LGSVLCNLGLNLLFVPAWGVYGSAAGTAITFVVQAIALVWLGRRLFGVRL